ncbi:hypothetical protein ACA910_019118 [Epithemia clementina (nom. ined.)]
MAAARWQEPCISRLATRRRRPTLWSGQPGVVAKPASLVLLPNHHDDDSHCNRNHNLCHHDYEYDTISIAVIGGSATIRVKDGYSAEQTATTSVLLLDIRLGAAPSRSSCILSSSSSSSSTSGGGRIRE